GLITTLLEMTFADNTLGLDVDLSGLKETDPIKLLFAENPGLILQVNQPEKVGELLNEHQVAFLSIGQPGAAGELNLSTGSSWYSFDTHYLRDVWFKTSHLLDKKQSGEVLAKERYESNKNKTLTWDYSGFTGKAADLALDLKRRKPSGTR